MAGQLSVNPYLKSFDEMQRTKKRMETYLDINFQLLNDEQKESINIMIEGLDKALNQVPEEFRVTKHFYSNKDKK